MQAGIEIGTTSAGSPAELALEELLATRLLVQGNSGSGKSHLLRRLLEQSAPFVQQTIVDPEGDFVTLADKFGHIVVEADRSASELSQIAARVREYRASVVLNLEGLDAEDQMRSAAAFLNGLFDAGREHWFPMLVVVDEAQLFAPAVAGDVSDEARKLSLRAMTDLMCRGRKRGLAGIIATQRLAKLAKNVAAEASNFLMGRTFLDIDMARAADLLGMDRRQAETFRDLERGQFVALGPALSRRPLPVRIGATETAARSGSPTLLPLPERPLDTIQDLILAPIERGAAPPARPRRAMPATTSDILVQLSEARARPAPEPVTAPPLSDEDREAALAEVLGAMVSDPDAAFLPIPALYEDFLVRCRMRRLGAALPMPAFKARLAVARAGVDESLAASPDWDKAAAFASTLPDDLHGVFLFLCKAALKQEGCPSDIAIARTCGSHSSGRARRLLSYMEQRGHIVCRTDFKGARIIALPDLGWETAPGDPNAPIGDACRAGAA